MKIELLKVKEKDKEIIYNLMQLYTYDMSTFEDETAKFKLLKNGLFEIKYLEYYWTEDTRHPFLIKYNNKIAGFVLVRFNENNMYEVSEFFILNRYRNLGIGKYVAKEVFKKFNGKWEVSTLLKNEIARNFWRKVISEFTNNKYEERSIKNNSRIAFYFKT